MYANILQILCSLCIICLHLLICLQWAPPISLYIEAHDHKKITYSYVDQFQKHAIKSTNLNYIIIERLHYNSKLIVHCMFSSRQQWMQIIAQTVMLFLSLGRRKSLFVCLFRLFRRPGSKLVSNQLISFTKVLPACMEGNWLSPICRM